MKVLVADDQVVTLRVLDLMLRRNGYDTVLARTGRQALDLLESVPGIDLLLTDIIMPELDGMELLCEIRERPEWRRLPVVISTVLAEVETVERATLLGCRHYLVKPVKEADLIKSVWQALAENPPETPADAEPMHGASSRDLLEDLPTKVELLERLLRGEAAPEESTSLCDIRDGVVRAGAGVAVDILDGLPAKVAALDHGALTRDYVTLLRELSVLQARLAA